MFRTNPYWFRELLFSHLLRLPILCVASREQDRHGQDSRGNALSQDHSPIFEARDAFNKIADKLVIDHELLHSLSNKFRRYHKRAGNGDHCARRQFQEGRAFRALAFNPRSHSFSIYIAIKSYFSKFNCFRLGFRMVFAVRDFSAFTSRVYVLYGYLMGLIVGQPP